MCFAFNVRAQTDSVSIPVYKRFPELPKFSIMTLPDSTLFTREDLHKKKPIIIMLFSPDCEHCKHAMRDLIAGYDQWKKADLILVTSLEFEHIRKFYSEFKLAEYPNIVIGRDGGFNLGSFYKLHQYPSIYVYNKKHEFVTEFIGSVNTEELGKAL
jgi:thiol-disulfide isomerase/thioredoxin